MTTIGIRLEDKSRWERRVPLVPTDLERLIEERGLRFLVQSSPNRIFPDQDFRDVGAEIGDDLSSAGVVFAVKEIPIDLLRADTTYAFFAHVIKGQRHNMPLLRRLLDQRCTLIEYERITDVDDRRLVLFGREAGQAGMIDSLHFLGKRFAHEGYGTPLSQVRMAHEYDDLADAKEQIVKVGEAIEDQHLALPDLPLVVAFTGRGNVAQGAQEIFDLLPFDEAVPEELADICSRDDDYYRNRVVKVRLQKKHLVAPEWRGTRFDLTEYREHPERYRGRLAEFLPYITALITGHFWTDRFPRFFTKEDAAELWRRGETKLRLIGDVTCDLDGAIELTQKVTTIDEPAFVYDPRDGSLHDGYEGEGVVVLSVDNFPCELPRDASRRFSHALRAFVPAIARADYDVPFDQLDLPEEVKKAVVTHRGELTPGYRYLQAYLDAAGA